ncbi:MAG TPA: Uma2 family endonuclease [Thermomicrobiales bacterium]|nr:Uma2 family endonuclease [Thermomicrobiales bacterium]
MNSVAQRDPILTVNEYLALNETSTIRHEYIDGHIYALAGASKRHNDIVINVVTRFREAARRSECRVRTLEIMLRVSESRYYFPDVLVACNPDDIHDRAIADPCVVVEVLSPSTEQVDQREKLFAYKTIESLRAYYIVHQDRMTVENHWRDEDGNWWHGTLHAVGTLHVPCLDTDLPLADIYEGVTFDDE